MTEPIPCQRIYSIISIVLCLGIASQVSAQNLFVFGDSLSEQGATARLTGLEIPGADVPSTAVGPDTTSPIPYVNGRWTNGPIYVDFLSELLGVDQNEELNFSVTGSLVEGGSIVTNLPPFADTFGLTGQSLPGWDEQIDLFLAQQPSIAPSDIVLIEMGNSDEFGAAIFGTDPVEAASAFGASFDLRVDELTQVGARRFVIFNTFDVSKLPALAGLPTGADIADAFGAAIEGAASNMVRAGLDVTVVDFRSLVDDVVAQPGKYGFDPNLNVSTPCAADPLCENGDRTLQDNYVYWDNTHGSAAFQEIIAYFVADTVLAPTSIAAQGRLAVVGSLQFIHDIHEQIDHRRVDKKGQGTFFASTSYRDGGLDSLSGERGFDYSLSNFQIGVGLDVSPQWTLGGALSFGDHDGDLQTGGVIDRDTVQIGVYASTHRDSDWIGDISLFLSDDDYVGVTRATGVAGQTSVTETDGHTYGSSIRFGRSIDIARGTLGLLAGLQYSRIHVDAYDETGAAGLDMHVADQDFSSLVGSVGAVLNYDIGAVKWVGEVSYEHEFQADDSINQSSLVSVPTVIRTTQSLDRDLSYFQYGLKGSIPLGEAASIGFSVHSLAGRSDSTSDVLAKLTFAAVFQ